MESARECRIGHDPGPVPSQQGRNLGEPLDGHNRSAAERLPQEILDDLVLRLPLRDACNLMQASKTLNSRVWRRLYTNALRPDNFLLCWACARGYSALVARLIEVPGDINRSFEFRFPEEGKRHATPLHIAVYYFHADIVTKLLAYGADVHYKDCQGRTALSYVRTKTITESLLSAGADANEADSSKCSVLLRVLEIRPNRPRATVEAVKLLLEKGDARTDVIGLGRMTPLALAANQHDLEMVDLLLSHNADPNFEPNSEDRESWGVHDYWLTPLGCSASRHDGIEVIKLLLKHGASINARWEVTSPLVEAVGARAIDNVKLLLAEGANVDFGGYTQLGLSDNGESDGEGSVPVEGLPEDVWDIYRSPLGAAVLTQNWEIARLILEAGANINCKDANALEAAASRLSFDAVEFLLDHGAELDISHAYARVITRIRDPFGVEEDLSAEQVLIHQEKCYKILDLLAERGAARAHQSSDFVDDEPIFLAKGPKYQDLLRKVVSHGFNVNFRWKTEISPLFTVLHQGLYRGYMTPETINFLLDSGADPCLGHRLRSTPLAMMILQDKKFLWGCKEWAMAQSILKHERGGPTVTAKYSAGMMAMFFSQAIVSAGAFELSERIVSFAKLTNARGRWGPDGISGLRELTLRPEYWREPWLRNGGDRAARRKLIMASKLVDKLCPGRGKADWFLKDLEPKTTPRSKPSPMPDEALESAFELLFLN